MHERIFLVWADDLRKKAASCVSLDQKKALRQIQAANLLVRADVFFNGITFNHRDDYLKVQKLTSPDLPDPHPTD